MHPKEAKKQKVGTGRLTRACLPNSEIRVGIDFSNDSRIAEILGDSRYESVLLYPGGRKLEHRVSAPAVKPLQVLVLDATWPSAKTMLTRSANLRNLPRLSIDPAAPSRFRIKQQPGELCLSTIESVHRVIEEADRVGEENTDGAHRVLLDVLDALVKQQMECASDPNRGGYRRRPYRPASERTPSKKWETRKFFLG